MRSPGHSHQACVPARTRVGEKLCGLRASGGVPLKAARVPVRAHGKGRSGTPVGIPLLFVLRSPPGHTFSI